jgi:3-deoxy-D-manno-octulosonate 8-phosphate phosphatase, YrbI family
MDILQRAKNIKMMVFDVDGTLTDGSVYVGVQGEMMKAFNVKDGLGIGLALQNGFKVALVTGRKSEMLLKRAQELGVSEIYQGVSDKVSVLKDICVKHDIKIEEVAFMGDDLNDFMAMQKVGLACVPNDAAGDVKQVAHYVTAENGGKGAARAFIEYILKAQDVWQKAVQSYVNKGYGTQ